MDWTTILVAASLFAAAFLQSATGFGLALVCMAFIPLLIPVGDAIAYVAIASLVVNCFVIFANRAGLSFHHAMPLVVGICIGIPVGYYALRKMDGEMVVRLLGIALMLISVGEFLQKRFARLAIPEKAGSPLSFLGGVLAGAFNVGGPPIVVYAYSRPWSKVEIVAILQTVFVAGGLTRNALMLHSGEYTAELLRLVAWSLPPAALAVWLGKLTLDRLPQTLLKRVAFALIFAMGLKYFLLG